MTFLNVFTVIKFEQNINKYPKYPSFHCSKILLAHHL